MQTVVVSRVRRIERLRTDRIRQGTSKITALERGFVTSFPPPTFLIKTGYQNETGEQWPTSHAVYKLTEDAGLPKSLSGGMFFSATCLANRLQHSALQSHAPFTVRLGVSAKLDHLRKIGARDVDGFYDCPPPKPVISRDVHYALR